MTTTVPVPPELLPVLRRYRTAELATVGRSGVPIAWPTTPLVADDGSSVLVGTSIGFPQKAYNVRREPRVALLFSDPTGSGSDALPQVLVQGTARCTEHVVTSPVGYERYWSRLWEMQPAGRVYDTNPFTRRVMDFYYMRIMITVTPERVATRPALLAPDRLSAPAIRAAQEDPYAQTVRRLPTYRSAVLSTLDSHGLPSLVRVRPSVDTERRVLLVDPGTDSGTNGGADGTSDPLGAGPASLLCHSHDEKLWGLQSMVCVGRLEPHSPGWAFVPDRFVPGAATDPLALLRMLRQNRRTARAYLERRELPRPAVPWGEYRAIKRGQPEGAAAHS